MGQGTLVTEQIDSGARFIREFEAYAAIDATFWIIEDGAAAPTLFVASHEISDENFDVAYGEVIRVAKKLNDPNLDPFQVKVVGIDDPFAKAAMDVLRKYGGKLATRFHGTNFGGMGVEMVYIYPCPVPAA